jgi:hypothetical protein
LDDWLLGFSISTCFGLKVYSPVRGPAEVIVAGMGAVSRPLLKVTWLAPGEKKPAYETLAFIW